MNISYFVLSSYSLRILPILLRLSALYSDTYTSVLLYRNAKFLQIATYSGASFPKQLSK
jgi:hypothetical protein